METANVETSAAMSLLIGQLHGTVLACLLLAQRVEYEHEVLRQLTHALNNINATTPLFPGSYSSKPELQRPEMGLSKLPSEMILEIGSHLDLSSRNALIQAGTLFADLLTPQLYDDGLRITLDLNDWLQNKPVKPRGKFTLRMQSCMHTWSSRWAMSYLLPKHQSAYVAVLVSVLGNALAILPLTHVLAMTGNVAILREVILRTGDIDLLDQSRWTPLQYAASYGHAEAVSYLLGAGANVLTEGPGGVSTVYAASFCSGMPKALSLVIEATRKAGGDVMKPNEFGDTPLHLAAVVGSKLITMCLIEEGANPLDTNSDGDVAASTAIVCGHEEIALLLIKRMVAASGNVSLPNGNGWTLLHHAANRSSNTLVRSLLDGGADMSLVDGNGKTPLDIALDRQQNDQVIDTLLERSTHTSIPDHTRTRMFSDALTAGDLDRAQTLLQKCPPPWPPAHINSLLWKAAAQSPDYEYQQFNLMMDLAQSETSALHFANEGGWSALHYLCSAQPPNSATAGEMIQLLTNEGIHLNGKNNAGLTPLHRAIYTKNRVPISLLLRGSCAAQGRATIPDFSPAINYLMKLDVSVSSLAMDCNGYTAIDRAVMEFEDQDVRTVFGTLLGWSGSR